MNSEAFINFVDEVYDGSRWHCTYRKTDKGYTKWLQAEPILKSWAAIGCPAIFCRCLIPVYARFSF